MQIDIARETERLVHEQIACGAFRTVDEVIQAGVQALREKDQPKSLLQFFRESPLVGLELRFERDPDTGARHLAVSGGLPDTNWISELVSIRPEPRVTAWIAATDEKTLFLSVLTLGIEKCP